MHFGSSTLVVSNIHSLTILSSSAFAPDIDPETYPICRIIKSVHNTIIEGFWRWFKEKMGLNLKAIILVGKDERIFSANVEFHL
jgi:hypothetical protein